jgi:hypothetical protein
MRCHLNQSLVTVTHLSYQLCREAQTRGSQPRLATGIKLTSTKRVGGLAQMVEHIPSKWDTLSSITNTLTPAQKKRMKN